MTYKIHHLQLFSLFMLRYAWYYDMLVCYLLQMENMFPANAQSITCATPMTLINSHRNYSNNRFWIWQMVLFDILLTSEYKFLDFVSILLISYLLMEIKRNFTCLFLVKHWFTSIDWQQTGSTYLKFNSFTNPDTNKILN